MFDRVELIRICWRPGRGSDNFKSDSSPMRDGPKNDIQHDISKTCERIQPKLVGQVGCVRRKDSFYFGVHLKPDPDTRIH